MNGVLRTSGATRVVFSALASRCTQVMRRHIIESFLTAIWGELNSISNRLTRAGVSRTTAYKSFAIRSPQQIQIHRHSIFLFFLHKLTKPATHTTVNSGNAFHSSTGSMCPRSCTCRRTQTCKPVALTNETQLQLPRLNAACFYAWIFALSG